MALTAAICTQCGAQIQVDETKEAGICPSCGTAFITEKVINKYVTNNNFAGATFNIQGGVDIENLYTLARRAVDAKNRDDVLKYYGQIRERNPDDWESTFYYAWFENGGNFHNYFNITADLIFKLEPEKQIEALSKMNDLFKNIGFKLENSNENSSFPLKDNNLYYNFLMKFFDEKNIDVINAAGKLIVFMEFYRRKNFYLEILSRQDKFYVPFLQKYHWTLEYAPSLDKNAKQGEEVIKEVEGNIEKLNALLDSDEDKKNNYLSYYKWLIEDMSHHLMPSDLKYVEGKIKELDSSYKVTKKAKENSRYNLKKINLEKGKNVLRVFSIITTILVPLLSIAGVVMLFYTEHPFWAILSAIVLVFSNIWMFSHKDDIDFVYPDEFIPRIISKILSFGIFIVILVFLNNNEFFWF